MTSWDKFWKVFFKLYILVGWPNSHSQKRQKSWKLSSTKLICSTSGFQLLSLWSPLVLLMRNLAKVNLRMNIEYWGLLKVLKLGEYLELRPGSCDTSLMELHRESNSSSFAISESTTQFFFRPHIISEKPHWKWQPLTELPQFYIAMIMYTRKHERNLKMLPPDLS